MSITSLLYRDTLPSDVRARYDRKIACISNDPYTLKKTEFDGDVASWPDVAYIDLVNYLIFSQSAYSKEELKKYKSIGDLHLFVAKVLNSISVITNVTE